MVDRIARRAYLSLTSGDESLCTSTSLHLAPHDINLTRASLPTH
jgi:hypothetical protein